MRSPRVQLLFLAAMLGLHGAGIARAQSGADPAAAQALFDEARKSMARGDLAAACPQLAESQRLDPAIGTLLNLADCYEKSGKTASAWTRFLEAADVARSLGQASREKTARGRAAALEARLSRLVVDVPPASRVPGLTVARDGIVLGEALWGVPAPVDPGQHSIVAKAPGHREFSTRFSVNGASQSVTVPPLVAESAPPPVVPTAAPQGPIASATAPPPSPPPPPPEPPASTWQRPTAYTLLGVGAVGVGLGVVFALRAKSKNSDSLPQCRPDDTSACTAEGKSLRDSARSSATIATVALGVGAAAAIGGVVLLVSAPSAKTNTAVRLGPGSLALEGTF